MNIQRVGSDDDYSFDYGDDAVTVSDNENDHDGCHDSVERTIKMKYQRYYTAGG